MKKRRIGLRAKIILLSSSLLILPWLGYQYVWEMENFLRQGQEQSLIGTTRALASVLHERTELFNEQASFLDDVDSGKDLYAYDLKQAINLDGLLSDWHRSAYQDVFYGQDYVRFQSDKNSPNPISFNHMVGKYNGYLYAYLQVNDKSPVFRESDSSIPEQNDHLIIALSTPQGFFQRYLIAVDKEGWFNAYLMSDSDNINQLQREKRIQGFWKLTATGYTIEFRLPLTMLGNKLGFSLHSVSDPKTRRVDNIIATSNTLNLAQLGTVLVPSPEIEHIVQGMSHSKSRIWVVDRHQRVIAKSGNIHQADGVWTGTQDQENPPDSLWGKLQTQLLAPLYDLVLSQPPAEFIDELQDATRLNSSFIKRALEGQLQSSWRFSKDNKAIILSAAHPIMLGPQVMGIVVAEETTNGIRMLRNKALEKLFNVLISIIFVATLLLFIFTSNIARRIRKLRDQANKAIDDQGRISASFIPSSSSDEIGDLSRSLSDMVTRLGQYHHYLEQLSSRLSHELRTPVAVVRSSLENLSLLPQNDDNKKYIERSLQGINRLNRILTSMSEATRIEQSLQDNEKQTIILNDLLSSCVQGYQMTYSNFDFQLTSLSRPLTVDADPDLIVQLLDKLIANAMEFSAPQDAIEITLTAQADFALLVVSNVGPLLPENMADQLLNSMVSVRSGNTQDKVHLGLGLFIAKMICEFHLGDIKIHNRRDHLGVEGMVRLPLIKS
ncbi:proteobacterial dedicated sortase system histidine kinase [Psychromonas sp.]|uniref:proteobacterial dedicated sortase system histidine kinase n=1 Tax=Psychromonas sp. TaxID=1884585 RepID=UPI00356749F2